MQTVVINEIVFDKKLETLCERIFQKPGMWNLMGDLGIDDTTPTYLKPMSNNGVYDIEMADIFEDWLKKNNVTHERYRKRSFKINSPELFNCLSKKGFGLN